MLPFFDFWEFLSSSLEGASSAPECIDRFGAIGSLADWVWQASDCTDHYLRNTGSNGVEELSQTGSLVSSVCQAYYMGCLASGAKAHAVGRAFFSGYQAAIRELFRLPSVKGRLYSYCITESEGNHPRNIQTTCRKQGDRLVLNGTKTFVTAPDIATDFLVVASMGWKGHINELAVLQCSLLDVKTSDNFRLDVFPSMAFVPEVRHGSAAFKQADMPASVLRAGSGYESYVKPFRWYEDVHVFAALFGLATAVAVRVDNQSVSQRLLSLSFLLCSLRPENHADRYSHTLCAGIMEHFKLMEADIVKIMYELSDEQGIAWERDKRIFDVAGAARKRRAELAWQSFRSPV